MTTSDKVREFGQKVMREYGRWWGVEAKDADKFVSDLTDLISEHYYPKEFVMWLSYNSSHYVIKTQNRWWSNSQDKYMTLDELFNYWKENEQ